MCLGCSVSLFVIVIIAAMICLWWLVVVPLFYIARMELPPLTINFSPKSYQKRFFVVHLCNEIEGDFKAEHNPNTAQMGW